MKIPFNPKLNVPVRLLRLALRIKSPLLTAFALALLTRKTLGKGAISLLALHKDQFEEDIAVLPSIDPRIEIRSLSLYYLKLMFRSIASEPLEGLSESNYHATSDWRKAKADYYNFLENMLPLLCKFTGIRGVITCNHNYIAQQEFSRACVTLNIPFFVVFKEGMIVPEREKDWHSFYSERYFSGPVNASVVYTSNSYVANWFANSPSIKSNAQLVPVGIPRTDLYKTQNMRLTSGIALVVFAYDPVFSFRYFTEIRGDSADGEFVKRLEERTFESYATIFEFARRNPEIPVIIKSKPRSLVERAIIPRLSKQMRGLGELSNVTLTNSVSAADLIRQARVIVALNSTTVAEALMSRRVVLTPDFEDFFRGRPWNYFYDFPSLYKSFANSADIEASMATPDTIPEDAARQFVERQLVSDTELASESLANGIISYLRGNGDEPAVQENHADKLGCQSLDTR